MKEGLRAVFPALIVLFATAHPAMAQDAPDFTKLSLQELMGLDVISINVLGSHIHLTGQWMIGYEYMFEDMDGNRDGTHRVNHTRVLQQFPTVPTKMTMEMHMAMAMYAPTNDLTLMAMLPYVRKRMDHVTRTGVRFIERSEGIGDLQLKSLATLYKIKGFEHRFLFNGGISLPTGSIEEKDFLPNRTQGERRLEYAMQLGSGTVDLLPGVTYLGQAAQWAWGGEMIPTIRLGRNSRDYALGNRYRLTAWGARKLTDWLSLSGRTDGQKWDNIRGADPGQNRLAAATKDPKRQAGERVDLLGGLNLYIPRGFLKGQRIAVEGGAPVYQALDGPNLQTDWQVRVGWQWVFH